MAPKVNVNILNVCQKPFNVEFGCVKTRFGETQLGTVNGAVCFLYFAASSQLEENIARLAKRWPMAKFIENTAAMKIKADQIFSDEEPEINVVLSGTAFQIGVWEALLKIPKGETWTYSDCANVLGKSSAVRAVANAVANNEIAYLIPCHRVVSKDGNKFKYRWGADYKKALLDYEQSY